MITSTRPAAKACTASAAARIIAVIRGIGTNGDQTGSRRSASTVRGPCTAYATTRASHTTAVRTKIPSWDRLRFAQHGDRGPPCLAQPRQPQRDPGQARQHPPAAPREPAVPPAGDATNGIASRRHERSSSRSQEPTVDPPGSRPSMWPAVRCAHRSYD